MAKTKASAVAWKPMERHLGSGRYPRGLKRAAEVAVSQVLAVKKNERMLVVTNPEADGITISSALCDAVAARGADTCLVVQPRRTSLDTASDAVIHAIRSEPDIVLSISSDKMGKDRFGLEKPYRFKNLKGSWPHIFNALLDTGRIRSFWSPSVTVDTFTRTVPVDYKRMAHDARKMQRALTAADLVHIAAPGGTDIEFGLRGRNAFLDDGNFRKAGQGGNIPAGEAYISPTLYDGSGRLVFDGSLAVADGGGAFVPRKPVTCEVEGGRVTVVRDGAGAERFEKSLRLGEQAARKMKGRKGWPAKRVAEWTRNARHLGELGIGLNPAARITGNMLEDEKILGTCHIAIGANYDNDADAFIHLDCLVKSPTITTISRNGRKRRIMAGGRIV